MSMQVHQFTTGGFVVHRIMINGLKSRYSAWFDAERKMIDCERIAANHRSYSVEHGSLLWSLVSDKGLTALPAPVAVPAVV